MESACELLDFDLEGEKIPNDQILSRLNEGLVEGVRVLRVYNDGVKIKHLAFLDCVVTLEYDAGVPEGAVDSIMALFSGEAILVEKKGKNGIVEQDIRPMIQSLTVEAVNGKELEVRALICCQNPTLNPMQLSAAVEKYLPHLAPDFTQCSRQEIYDTENKVFR